MRSSCSIIGENKVFFGICSSVSFAPISLVSTDSHKKFFLLFVLIGNTIPGNTMIYCLKYLMSIITTGSRQLLCKGTIFIGESKLLFVNYSSVPFAPGNLVSANYVRNSTNYSYPQEVLFLRIQEYFVEYLMPILKQKSSLLE